MTERPPALDGAARRATWRFVWALGAIGLAAFLLRLTYARFVPGALGGDARFYHELANLLGDGHGYVNPDTWRTYGRVVPTAFRLPGFPSVLALSSFVGARSIEAHRVVTCLLGTGTVVVLGLLGRRLGGARLGLVTAGLAAAYPNLWVTDGLLTVETMYALVVAVFLLCCYRYLDRPTTRGVIELGVITGIAALTRTEAGILFVVAALPVILSRPSQSFGRRALAALGAVGVAVLLVAPWVVYNLTRFEKPVVMSTNSSFELAVANCATAYDGPLVGFWDYECGQFRAGDSRDESEQGPELSDRASEYATGHLTDLPRVAVFRVARVWDLYHPSQNAYFSQIIDGRDSSIIEYGRWAYYLALPVAVAGIVVCRRRKIPVYPLLAMGLVVTLVAVLSHGEIRFRIPAELAIVVLAAVAIEAGVSRWAGRARARHKARPEVAGAP